MPDTRKQLVGQMERPGRRSEVVKLVVDERSVLTREEIEAGLEWVDGRYEFGDLRRYGGIGDDSTNNFTALSNAISVGEVYVPQGTFLVTITSTSISLVSNLRITGPGTIKWTSNTSTTSFLVGESLNNILINVGAIDGDYTTAGLFSDTALTFLFRACNNIEVQGTRFQNMAGDALYFGPLATDQATFCEDVHVHHCRFSDIGRNGIAAVTGVNHQYHHNTLTGSTGDWYGSAVIDLEPNNTSARFERFHIHNNVIECDDINAGIRYLTGSGKTAANVNDINISYNSIILTGDSDDRLILYNPSDGTPTDTLVRINNNTCIAPDMVTGCISLINANGDAEINGNYIESEDDGITVSGHNNTNAKITLNNNKIRLTGTTGRGIYVLNSDIDLVEISGNSVEHTTSTEESIYVEASGDTVNKVIMRGNVADDDLRVLNAPWVCEHNTSLDLVVDSGSASDAEFFGNIRNSNRHFEGSATWDPASIADGASATTTISTDGATTGSATAAVGDYVEVGIPLDLQGLQLTARVSATNTVQLRLDNNTGGAIDLASATWNVRVRKAH